MPTACQIESPRRRSGAGLLAGRGHVPLLREPTRCGLPTMRVWSTSPTWTRPNATRARPPPPRCSGRSPSAAWSGVATTFVDNSGVARVKAVPLDRLPHLAAWGVGQLDLLRPVPLRRLDRRRRRRARGRRRPARDARRTPRGAARRHARVGLGPRRPLPAGRHAARPVRPAAARLARRGRSPRSGITMKAAVELEWVVSHDSATTPTTTSGRRARAGVRDGAAGRRLRLLPRPAGRAGGLGRGRRAVPPRVRARASSSSPSPPRTRCPRPTPRCWCAR